VVSSLPASSSEVPEPSVRQASELRSARVESLRAIAALAVMEGHIFGASLEYGPRSYNSWWHRSLLGGGFGVFLFFTLSGYLLYLPFARRSFGAGRPVELGRYAWNRALRILPLYYVVAVTYLAVYRAPARHWLVFLLFLENFSRGTVAQVDGPMWSLVVELTFYLFLPLLAAGLAWASRRSLPAAFGWVGVLGLGAGVYRWVAFLHPAHPGALVQYNFPATFYFFVPGLLLALLKVALERRGDQRPLSGPWGRPWLWLLTSAAGWAVVFDHYSWDLILGPASFLLLGSCVLPLRPSVVVRALGWRPLAGLGTASYSLYLWHLPIVYELSHHRLGGYVGQLIIAGSTCVVVALVSYRLVELPFLRFRTRWGETAARDEGGPRPLSSRAFRRSRL